MEPTTQVQRLTALDTMTPAPHLSEKYEMMPTRTIVDVAAEHGFTLGSYLQVKTRNANNSPYAKHILSLRKQGLNPDEQEVIPEILVINSHDGKSRLQMMLGFLRVICTNGLIAGDVLEELANVRHTHKNPFDSVLESLNRVYDNVDTHMGMINQMREVQFTRDDAHEFATRAADLIRQEFPNRVYEDPSSLLFVNRLQDEGNSLWLTFNRVQENMMRGGNRIHSTNGRFRASRAIKGINSRVSLNRGLWNLAARYLPS